MWEIHFWIYLSVLKSFAKGKYIWLKIDLPTILWKKSWVLIWNGEKCDRKWFSVIQNGRRQPFCEQNLKKKLKLRIDLKWREMRLKVIFGHPKWPPAAILWKHLKQNCVLIWNVEKVIFGNPKWGGGGITMASLAIRGYTQYLPLGKDTNASFNWLHQCVIYWWACCRNKTIYNFKWNGLTNLCWKYSRIGVWWSIT